jgi:hypothetical protein
VRCTCRPRSYLLATRRPGSRPPCQMKACLSHNTDPTRFFPAGRINGPGLRLDWSDWLLLGSQCLQKKSPCCAARPASSPALADALLEPPSRERFTCLRPLRRSAGGAKGCDGFHRLGTAASGLPGLPSFWQTSSEPNRPTKPCGDERGHGGIGQRSGPQIPSAILHPCKPQASQRFRVCLSGVA